MYNIKQVIGNTLSFSLRYFMQLIPLGMLSYIAYIGWDFFYAPEAEEEASLAVIPLLILTILIDILFSIFIVIFVYRLFENGTLKLKDVFNEFRQKCRSGLRAYLLVTLFIILGGLAGALAGGIIAFVVLTILPESEYSEIIRFLLIVILAIVGAVAILARYYFVAMNVLFRGITFSAAKELSLQQTKNIRIELIAPVIICVILIFIPVAIMNSILTEHLFAIPIVMFLAGIKTIASHSLYVIQYKYYADRIQKD